MNFMVHWHLSIGTLEFNNFHISTQSIGWVEVVPQLASGIQLVLIPRCSTRISPSRMKARRVAYRDLWSEPGKQGLPKIWRCRILGGGFIFTMFTLFGEDFQFDWYVFSCVDTVYFTNHALEKTDPKRSHPGKWSGLVQDLCSHKKYTSCGASWVGF